MKNRLVVYHARCSDGFAAAWAAWRLFGYEGTEYLAARYGDAPPDVTDRDVLVVDFSYPRDAMIAMEQRARTLVVLDHHKTAEAALAGLPFATFDMNRSGAGLAWDVLHPLERRPWLIDYVEDRDLWRFRLPHSKAVSERIHVTPFAFETWDELSWRLVEDVASEGEVLLLATESYLRSARENAREMTWFGRRVWCVNTTHATSELVGALSEGTHFAVGWFQREDGKFVYSLRSRSDAYPSGPSPVHGDDVSSFARLMGGGGHRNAAGFTSSLGPDEAAPVSTGEALKAAIAW
jgi:oligoribonuclease NrnB/cAMP/cGMP phosphodiesterase (DHH superfamily)